MHWVDVITPNSLRIWEGDGFAGENVVYEGAAGDCRFPITYWPWEPTMSIGYAEVGHWNIAPRLVERELLE